MLKFRVEYMPGKDHHVADAMSRFPVEKPKDDESWRPWEPSRKRGCRPAETADDIEQATKVAVQAAICYALTTPDRRQPMVQDYAMQGEANTATS